MNENLNQSITFKLSKLTDQELINVVKTLI